MNRNSKQICAVALTIFYGTWAAPTMQAYAFSMLVPDVRQPVAISGGSACPVRAHQLTTAGSLAVRWSTALNTNPVTVFTQNQTASGRLAEIEQVITQSLAAWTGVSGSSLAPATLAPLARTATQNACGSDGVNSICFDQADMAFTPGVVAFTRVIATDRIGMQVGGSAVATQLGQILDADIYFNPSGSPTTYATPQALASNSAAYDLESVLTHELGTRLDSAIRPCGPRSCFRSHRRREPSAGCGPRCSNPMRRSGTTIGQGWAYSMPTRRMRCMPDRFAGKFFPRARWRCPLHPRE